MKRKLIKILSASLILFSIVFVSSCNIGNNDTDSGSLTINMSENVSRTLLPELSMEVVSYEITGTGPDDSSFTRAVTDDVLTVEKLAFGLWTVSVTAFNVDGTAIGSGNSDVTVHSNETSEVSVTVVPFTGDGSLNLTLNWTDGDIETPQITATLLPETGEARILDFTISDSTATFNTSDIPAGYYTLTVQLSDNGALTMGTVEIVRIIKDETTNGTLYFDLVNKPGGTISVNIVQEMADPLVVSIANSDRLFSASILEYTDNVTYVWYVNGNSAGTGQTFNLDSTYEQGFYNVSVTAFSIDGSRGGSSTTNVQVVDNATNQGTIDPANLKVLNPSIYEQTGFFMSAGAYQNYLYCSTQYKGLGTFDITNPDNPVLVYTNADNSHLHSNFSFVKDSYYYNLYTGVNVFSLANPARPTLVKNAGGGYVNSYLVDDNTIFLACNGALQIIDITTPDNAQQVANMAATVNYRSLAKSGNILAASSQKYNIDILDVTLISAPEIISSIPVSSAVNSLAMKDNTLYVPDQSGIDIYDLTDPNNPQKVSTISKNASKITIQSGMLMVYTSSTFGVYDLTNAQEPVFVKEITLGTGMPSISSAEIKMSGNLLVASSSNGFMQINIQDPTNPVFAGAVSGDYYYGFAQSGDRIYLSRWGYGLDIYQMDSTNHINKTGNIMSTGRPFALTMKDNFLYLSDEFAGLKIFDATTPGSPTLVKQILDRRPSNSISFQGNIGYASFESSGIKMLDLTTPSDPIDVGDVKSVNEYPWGNFAFNGTYMYYVSWAKNNVYIADIATNSTAIKIGHVVAGNSSGSLLTVKTNGNYLYAAGTTSTGSGLSVFSLADPAKPMLVGTMGKNYVYDVEFRGNNAYLVGPYGLDVYNVASPENPQLLGSLATVNGKQILLDGNFAYIGGNGFNVVDISDPGKLTIVKTISLPNLSVKGFTMKAHYIYVASDTYGISVLSDN